MNKKRSRVLYSDVRMPDPYTESIRKALKVLIGVISALVIATVICVATR